MRAHFSKIALLVVLCAAAPVGRAEEKKSAAPPASDFVRFQEDAKGAQLQTAIATYRSPSGVKVELIGAIHIGDKAYYAALNRRFTSCEVVLYEMVGEALEVEEPEEPVRKSEAGPTTPKRPLPEDRTSAIEEYPDNSGNVKPKVVPKLPPLEELPAEEAARERMSWLHPMYHTLKNTLKLESQMEGIDYSKKNFVHADMTAREFAFTQKQRGEGFLQMWLRSVQAQIAKPEIAPKSPGLLKILEILCRPDSPTELKRLLGRMFDQVEKLMAGIESEDGSVILTERNKVALNVMKTEIAKGRRHLGIFYGAAHLPDMEKRLLAMGYEREKVEWLTAWDLPPEPPPPPAKKTRQ